MTTLVVSDLHLGAQSATDVARRPELRAPLLEALEGVDHLVLLGDVLELPYPGLWLRADVYAIHGHYLDMHISVPSFERVGARAVNRIVRGNTAELRTPDDYEAALSPIYALLDEVAQVAPDRGTGGSGASERAWKLLMGDGRRRRPTVPQLAAWAAYPLAIAALNRAGLGPLSPSLSGSQLRRASVAALGGVL